MKPSSTILLILFFVTNVLAGGLRGAYKRLFIWFAYQAEIEWLQLNPGQQRGILPGVTGTGPGQTLTFNEFIDFSNSEDKSVNRATLDENQVTVDRTAGTLVDNNLVAKFWRVNTRVIRGASYDNMLRQVGQFVYLMKTTGTQLQDNNPNILAATQALENVVNARAVDYEKYRMPGMREALQFRGIRAWKFDLQYTLDLNSGRDRMELTRQIDEWTDAYNNDESPVPPNARPPPRWQGERWADRRLGHFHAMNVADESYKFLTAGRCS